MQSYFGELSVHGRQQSNALNPIAILGTSLARWHNASNLGSLWQDSARSTPVATAKDPLGCFDDLSGNGRHWKQATSGMRLAFEENVYGNFHAALGDGVDDVLVDAVYNEVANETWWLAVELLALGSVGIGQGIVGTTARVIFEQGNDNQYEMYGGATLDSNTALPVAYTRKILKVTWNGASSGLAVNGTQVVTGNAGAGFGTNVSIGICGGQPLGEVKYFEAVTMAGNPTAAQDALMTAYLSKYNPQ
jgi:hypothetical protein